MLVTGDMNMSGKYKVNLQINFNYKFGCLTLFRQLENEVVEEWSQSPTRNNELLPLVHNIVKFDAQHHAEIQACDMLMEIDRLELLAKHITADTYKRICLYLSRYLLLALFRFIV